MRNTGKPSTNNPPPGNSLLPAIDGPVPPIPLGVPLKDLVKKIREDMLRNLRKAGRPQG